VYDRGVVDAPRPTRGPRSESRETAELRTLRTAHPELGEAIDLQLEILELYRRVQGRVPVPWIDISTAHVTEHAATGQPLVAFEAIPIELTDLRLLVRQSAETMRRHGVIDDDDYARVQAIGRDMGLLIAVGDWYRSTSQQHVTTPPHADADEDDPTLGQVLTVAMRPFLSRCAEVVQQRPELSLWTCGHCAVCGGDPELSVLTSSGERLLICGRCGLQWHFDAPTCPYCRNSDPTRISSFAMPGGPYRVDACEVCQRYVKAFDAKKSSRPVMPVVDSVATLMLDAAALQRGYAG
jgi:hypothetical protein